VLIRRIIRRVTDLHEEGLTDEEIKDRLKEEFGSSPDWNMILKIILMILGLLA
jgi:hypothetical protein